MAQLVKPKMSQEILFKNSINFIRALQRWRAEIAFDMLRGYKRKVYTSILRKEETDFIEPQLF